MNKNSEFHNRKSIRLKTYDYTKEGLYFITISTKDKLCLFGHILEGKMILNKIGAKVVEEIINTEKIRKNIKMHEFIVMPNHIHFIMEIKWASHLLRCTKENHDCRDFSLNHPIDKIKLKRDSVGAIVGQLKSVVTKWVRNNTDIYNVWQRNYYENIIRDKKVYEKVSNYIKYNPLKWNEDKYFIK